MDDIQGPGALKVLASQGPYTPPRHPHLAAGQIEVLDGARHESVQHHGDTSVERKLLVPTAPCAVRGGRAETLGQLEGGGRDLSPGREGSLILGI